VQEQSFSSITRKYESASKVAKRRSWNHACTILAVVFVRYPKLVALAGISEAAQNLFDFIVVKKNTPSSAMVFIIYCYQSMALHDIQMKGFTS